MAKIKIFKDTNNNENIQTYELYDVIYAREVKNSIDEEYIAIVLEVYDGYIVCELAKGENILSTKNLIWVQRGNLIDINRKHNIALKDTNSGGSSILSYDSIDLGNQLDLNADTYNSNDWNFANSTISISTKVIINQTSANDGIILYKKNLGELVQDEIFYVLVEYNSNNDFEVILSDNYTPIVSLNEISSSIVPVKYTQGYELLKLVINTNSINSYFSLKTINTSTDIKIETLNLFRVNEYLNPSIGLDFKIGKIGNDTGLWTKTIKIGETLDDVKMVFDKGGLTSTDITNKYAYTAPNTLSEITTDLNDVNIFKVAQSYDTINDIALQGFSLRYNSGNSYLELATSNSDGPLDTSLYVTQSGSLHQLEDATFSKDVNINDIRIMDNEILNYTDSTDNGILKLNYSGYNGYNTKFRTLSVGDGRGNNIFSAIGNLSESYVHFSTKIQNNMLSIKDEHINNYSEDNDSGTLYLNSIGYDNGITRFRKTIIGNGKGLDLLTINGSENRIYNNTIVNFEPQDTLPEIINSKNADVAYETHINPENSKNINNMYVFTDDNWRPIGTKVFPIGTTEEDADLAGAKEGDMIII